MTDWQRLAVYATGMAGVFYAIAAAFLWCLIGLRGWRARPSLPSLDHKNVVLDRALAWTALATLFLSLASFFLERFGVRALSVVAAAACAVVLATGLWSVHEITRSRYGNRVLSFFIVAIAIAGGMVWLMI